MFFDHYLEHRASAVTAMLRSGHGRASREKAWRLATVAGGLPLHLGRLQMGGEGFHPGVSEIGVYLQHPPTNHCERGKTMINYLILMQPIFRQTHISDGWFQGLPVSSSACWT